MIMQVTFQKKQTHEETRRTHKV